MSQVAHQAGTYPVSLAWANWEYFYSLLDGMLIHPSVTPSSKFAGTHLYTWVKRGTMRVKSLVQEHSTVWSLDPESSPLTINAPLYKHKCHLINTLILLFFNTWFLNISKFLRVCPLNFRHLFWTENLERLLKREENINTVYLINDAYI